jgi:hypothetical protein
MSCRGCAGDRDEMLRRVLGRAAGCWMVAVWYRNGRSDPRERDIARIVCEHSDIDKVTLWKVLGAGVGFEL